MADKYEIKVGGSNKLVLNLCSKSTYLVYYRNF